MDNFADDEDISLLLTWNLKDALHDIENANAHT
jgi:hypothetical protein